MENELSKFLKKRKITAKQLFKAQVIKTRKGEFASMAYLSQVMTNESAGISLENIDRIDKAYKLLPEERANLLTMIKKGEGKVELSPEIKEAQKKEHELLRHIQRHRKILDECITARDLIQQLSKKAGALKLLLCVDWGNHPDVNAAPGKMLEIMVQNFLDNRIEAAGIQLKLLNILEEFQSIVLNGLDEGNNIFLKLPSAFNLFDPQDLRKETREVYEYGKDRMMAFIENDTQRIKNDFIHWIRTESDKNAGLVDVNDYAPAFKFLDPETLFSIITFPDMAYTKVSFFILPPTPMLELYGISDVITAVEQFALQVTKPKKEVLLA